MAAPPMLDPRALQPFVSFAILRYTGSDPALAVHAMTQKLRRMAMKTTTRRAASIPADGIDPAWLPDVIAAYPEDPTSEIDGFAVQVEKPPSWATTESGFVETSVELYLVFRRGDLVAVHCPRSKVDALQNWMDREPRPPFRRVDGPVLQVAFLEGEARGLWLRGTHPRRASKADSKNLSGLSLGEALDPFEDSSFALTSGRSTIDGAPGYEALDGVVGTTPRKAWVWHRAVESLESFVHIARDALALVAAVPAAALPDLPFPVLAVEENSFAAVEMAYDAFTLDPEDVAQLPDASDDDVDRAARLQGTVIDVIGTPGSPYFTLTVGRDGAAAGELRCRPDFVRGRVRIDIGIAGSPSDPRQVARIRNDLADGDLLTVHYESGQVLSHDALTRTNVEPHPFRGWQFKSYTGFDVTQEKPPGAGTQEIHDAIGNPLDVSLFGWVVWHLGEGHLACDDGSNEVADFVHIADDGTLSILHIKAAGHAANRRVSSGAFELVTAQAQKNLRMVTGAALDNAMSVARIAQPATWVDGARVADRTDFLEALRARIPADRTRVVIIQPHIDEATIDRLRDEEARGVGSQDLMRLHLIETSLNAAHGAAVRLGADLEVWAAA